MSRDRVRYCLVEHIWRALRACLILIATGLWLYELANPHVIFLFYFLATLVDQLHGKICCIIEKALRFQKQHEEWE